MHIVALGGNLMECSSPQAGLVLVANPASPSSAEATWRTTQLICTRKGMRFFVPIMMREEPKRSRLRRYHGRWPVKQDVPKPPFGQFVPSIQIATRIRTSTRIPENLRADDLLIEGSSSVSGKIASDISRKMSRSTESAWPQPSPTVLRLSTIV